ncbi:unnamed protein product [Schistosoma haematobium]|nr:unnamed protein product [Schistosoma haematobium]
MIQFGCYTFIFSLVNHYLPSYPSLSSTSTSTWMTMNNSSTQSSSSHESPVLLTDSLSVVTKDFLKLSKNNNLLVHQFCFIYSLKRTNKKRRTGRN